MDITTITLNPCIDKMCSVNRVVPDQKLRCSPPRLEPGGGGLNVALAVKALQGQARALWSRGGRVGQMLSDLLDDSGLDHHPVDIAEETRINHIVFEEQGDGQQQFRFNLPGPELTEEDEKRWTSAVSAIDPASTYVVFSGSLPRGVGEDIYAALVRSLPESCRTIMDTSGEALIKSLGSGTYLIKPNLRELGQIAGRKIDGERDIERVARQVIERGGAEVVVVSIGSGGAVVVTDEGKEHIRAPTVRVRNRVGAGDSMVAGMVVQLSQGVDPVEAARYGVAAGAAAVTQERTGLCRREDTEELYSQMKTQ